MSFYTQAITFFRGWTIGRTTHNLHEVDRNMDQGQTREGSELPRITNNIGLLAQLMAIVSLFKPVADFGQHNTWHRYLKLGILIFIPIFVPIAIAVAAGFQKNKKTGFFTTLETSPFYNKFFGWVRWLTDSWLFSKAHNLIASKPVKKLLKTLENNLALLIKLSIMAIMIPLFMAGQALLASVIIGLITLSYLAERQFFPPWFSEKLHKFSYPLGLTTALVFSLDPVSKILAVLELYSLIRKPYLAFRERQGQRISKQKALDMLVEEAFKNSNKNIKTFDDLFNSAHRFDIIENLRVFNLYAVGKLRSSEIIPESNLHRLNFDYDSMVEQRASSPLNDPEFIKASEIFKFEDFLDLYDSFGMFRDPDEINLLIAGPFSKVISKTYPEGNISNERFARALEDRAGWYNSSIFSHLSPNHDTKSRITKELLSFKDKVWSYTPEDRLAFAKFSLLSILYKLENGMFTNIAQEGIAKSQLMAKSFYLVWQKKLEAIQEAKNSIETSFSTEEDKLSDEYLEKIESLNALRTNLREQMKDLALNGDLCPQGNLQELERLYEKAHGYNAKSPLAVTLPLVIKDVLRKILFLNIEKALRSESEHQVIDVNEQHTNNQIARLSEYFGLETHSSKYDLSLDRGFLSPEAFRLIVGDAYNNIFMRTIQSCPHDWALFVCLTASLALSKSKNPAFSQCDPALIELWYAEKLGFYDPKKAPKFTEDGTPESPWMAAYTLLSEAGDDEKANKLLELSTTIIEHSRANADMHDNYVENLKAYFSFFDMDFATLLLPILLKEGIFISVSPDATKRPSADEPSLKAEEKTSWSTKIAAALKSLVKAFVVHGIGLTHFGLYCAYQGLKALPSFTLKCIKATPSFIKNLVLSSIELIQSVGRIVWHYSLSALKSPLTCYDWLKTRKAPEGKKSRKDTVQTSPTVASSQVFTPLQNSTSVAVQDNLGVNEPDHLKALGLKCA